MIAYMADTFYSALNDLLPIVRDVIGASMFLASLSFPFVFFISLFISIKKYKKEKNSIQRLAQRSDSSHDFQSEQKLRKDAELGALYPAQNRKRQSR